MTRRRTAATKAAPHQASGGLWTMYRADCVEFLQGFGAVDHCITDPPYEAEAHTKARRSSRGAKPTALGIPFAQMDEATRAALAVYCAKNVERWTLTFCQAEAVALWAAVFGASYRRACVWVKPAGPGCAPQFTGDRPGMGHESIACAHGSAPMRWNGGGRNGVFTHQNNDASSGGFITAKPLPLMLELVRLFTDPNDLVLDPFAGSGSTGVACVRLGRRFVGIEREPRYFDLACERLRAEEQGLTLQAARAGQVPMFAGVR
jgi:site-specific DNA-methyltransferase (adenine-specific)